MLRQSLRALAVAAVAAFALGPSPATAVTFLPGCAQLTKAGETYIVTSDIEWLGNGACFLVNADRITLDLAGHTITGSGSSSARTTQGVVTPNGRTLTVVKNGTFKAFQFGVLEQGSRATIRNVTATDSSVGIKVGVSALVKDCTAQRNVSGVLVQDNGQVEGCLIEDNGFGIPGGGGLFGGRRLLITRNIVRGNDGVGINVDSSSTVTHNTVSANDGDGINVGPLSLVTGNTSNENGGDGVHAACPATITHNTALDNGGLPINPPTTGNGCVLLHNITSDGGSCLTGDDEQSLC